MEGNEKEEKKSTRKKTTTKIIIIMMMINKRECLGKDETLEMRFIRARLASCRVVSADKIVEANRIASRNVEFKNLFTDSSQIVCVRRDYSTAREAAWPMPTMSSYITLSFKCYIL